MVGDSVVQLTWRSGRALVYDRHTLKLVCEHRYEGEGWGLCRMGEVLWMSDGSNRLTQRDTTTFEVTGEVTVAWPDGGTPVEGLSEINNLNELECIGDRVIANVWQTDNLLVIDIDKADRNSMGQNRGNGSNGTNGLAEGTGKAAVSAVIDASPLIEDVRPPHIRSQRSARRAERCG